MKSFIVIIGFIFTFICEFQSEEINCDAHKNTNFYLNTKQTIRKYGYPAESHVIKTADGYLLELHRIPNGKFPKMSEESEAKGQKPPVFFHHGLLGSSMDFFIIGSKDALPFLLADLGFDVWLGNVRSNTYSRAHVALFPDEKKFWNFTWHQSAIYDVPAQIDFICNYTKQEKVIYIGFSMGTTIFFAMTTTLPEYNKKIEISLLMASVAYVENIKSPLIRFLAYFSEKIKDVIDLLDNGAFLSDNTKLLKLFCEVTKIQKSLCMNIIFLIVGSDPKEFNKTLTNSLINHYPAGYSVKGANHYAQLLRSGKFRQYDYGPKGNMLEYGSPVPPDYDLSLITTPIYIYEGENDFLSDLTDAKRLAKELKTLRRMRVVEYPKFSHLDFILSVDVKKLVYDILIKDLMSHLNDDNHIY